MRPRLPADAFENLRLTDGELVRFVAPVPIYQAELKPGRRRGPTVLAKALNAEAASPKCWTSTASRSPGLSFLDKLKALFSKD